MLRTVVNLSLLSFALQPLFASAVSSSPASIDSNGDPTWLSYKDMQDNQFNHPATHRVLNVFNSSNADFKKLSNKKVWTVAVVTARETIIGCRSFREFLSPEFPTVFLMDQWIADPLYNMTAFVKSLTAKDTLGAHLIITNEKYGEVFDRKVAMDFLDVSTKGLNITFDTMFAINCDQHPVNPNFYLYKTIPNVARTLYQTMVNETNLRRKGQTHVRNVNERSNWPVFGVIPVIFEANQPQNNAISGFIHGADVDGFKSVYNFVKPVSMGSNPWVIDTLSWPEGHIMLLNYSLLHALSAEYFSVTEYLSEMRVLPVLLRRHNMTMLRNNEVTVLFDISTYPSDLANPEYQKIRTNFPMNDMLLRNYEIVTMLRSPQRLNISYFDIRSRPIKADMDVMFGPSFDAQRIKAHWIPSNVNGSTLNTEVGRRFFKAEMMLFGYYENLSYPDTKVRQYVMSRVYPTSLKVTFNFGYRFIGSLLQNGTQTKMYVNDWKNYTFNGKKVCYTVACLNPTSRSERTITVSRGAYLQDLQTAHAAALHYDAVHLTNQQAPMNRSFTAGGTGGISTKLYDIQAKLSP